MAKIYKVMFYFVDIEEQYRSGEELEGEIERSLDTSISHYNVHESKSFEWDDDILINYSNCPVSEYEKYFE